MISDPKISSEIHNLGYKKICWIIYLERYIFEISFPKCKNKKQS